MGNFLQDVRYGIRSLLHAPTFTALTVLTLMLAIGVNSAIFSMVNVILFSEMPVEDQDTAVFVWVNSPERGIDRGGTSLPDFLDMRDSLQSFDAIVGFSRRPGVLSGVDEPARVTVGLMTADMLATWRLPAFIGRNFAEAFAKGMLAAGARIPVSGTAFLSVCETDKKGVVEIARELHARGFKLVATAGTAKVIREGGVECQHVNKVKEGRPHVVDMIKNKEINLVINTSALGVPEVGAAYDLRRTALMRNIAYFTTIGSARAGAKAIVELKQRDIETHCLQEIT